MFRRALEAAVAADRAETVDGGAETAVGGSDVADEAVAGRSDRTGAVDEAAGVERGFGRLQADALGRLAECALAGETEPGYGG